MPPASVICRMLQLACTVILITGVCDCATGRRTIAQSPRHLPPVPAKPDEDPIVANGDEPLQWWANRIASPVTDRDRWVRFDLETILLDTLANSPRVLSVAYQTASRYQEIIQQDAAFDSTVLLNTNLGATNDPVGNTLTTGGANRLREKSLNLNAGARKLTRRGTELEWGQELGFLDSNSEFFLPNDQGNSRLSLNLTKPLLSRGGRYYNERLVTQARIESNVAWQEMRADVEQRISDVILSYWRLYQARAQLTQQRELLVRSQQIERVLSSRKNFDASKIEIVKARARVARRADQVVELEAELKKQQSRLATLVGSEVMIGVESDVELIPTESPIVPEVQYNLREAVAQALQNRPEIRAATHDVQLSALELRVTRVELEPQLNWVFNGYLSQLNGVSRVGRSFLEQFENAPGVSSGLEFELPRGRRAAKAQHREALFRAKERSERLREAIQQTRFEVETTLIDIQKVALQIDKKRDVLAYSLADEKIQTVQWQIMGGDRSRIGVQLEQLLDAQQRRTDAEQDLVAAEVSYMTLLVQLQRAMGTLLINEGIRPDRVSCYGEIEFRKSETLSPDSTVENTPPADPQQQIQRNEEPVEQEIPLHWHEPSDADSIPPIELPTPPPEIDPGLTISEPIPSPLASTPAPVGPNGWPIPPARTDLRYRSPSMLPPTTSRSAFPTATNPTLPAAWQTPSLDWKK